VVVVSASEECFIRLLLPRQVVFTVVAPDHERDQNVPAILGLPKSEGRDRAAVFARAVTFVVDVKVEYGVREGPVQLLHEVIEIPLRGRDPQSDLMSGPIFVLVRSSGLKKDGVLVLVIWVIPALRSQPKRVVYHFYERDEAHQVLLRIMTIRSPS
jgi:hypothetical protein